MNKEILLNIHTFRRIFDDYTYLENQANHVSVRLLGVDKQLVDNLTYEPVTVDMLCDSIGVYTSVDSLENLLLVIERLHQLWLIDFSDDEPRDFSYENKIWIEEKFSSTSSLFPDVQDAEPWLSSLQIELTDQCNERCVHCYIPNAQKDKGKSLEINAVRDVIKQYRDMNGLKVVFSGGEILLYRDFFEILEYCRELNLMILIQSNLLILTAENINKLKSLDLFNVQVSLYSTNETIHDSITGRKGSYLRTKRNLELLVANDIPALISCPVMQQNYSTIRSLKEYADYMGVDCYFDYIMMAQSDGCHDNLNVRLTLEQTRQVINDILDTRKDFMKAIESATSLDDLLKKKFARRWSSCKILSSGMCIDADGTVYPCPGWNGLSLGDIKHNPLGEIWFNNSKAKELRVISKANYLQCSTCNLLNFCDMCPVYNFNENGDIYHVCQRFCKVAELLKECVTSKYHQLNGQTIS